MKNLSTFLVLAIVSSGLFVNAQTTWYVKSNATGNSSGTSWNNAFTEIDLAINSAQSGDLIFVAKGTYYPTSNPSTSSDPRDQSILLLSGLKIYGGFAGTESYLFERDKDSLKIHGSRETILSGDIGVIGDSSDNVYHILLALGQDSILLDGFTISGGNANSISSYSIANTPIDRNFGGGLYLHNSSVSLSNCIVRDNLSVSGGSGINSEVESKGEIVDSWFVENKVWGSNSNDFGGGGMRNDSSSPSLENVGFIQNEIHDIQGGAGIRNESSSNPLIENCLFKGNLSFNGDGGSGIYNASNSNPQITLTTFKENETSDQGAGMYNDNSKPNITHCQFIANHADGGGGAIEADGGSDFTMTNTELIENTTDDNGGAIQLWKSSPTFNDVQFIDNEAANDGGGLFNYNTCSPEITNTLFEGNKAGRNGGGIYNRRDCHPIITNTLIVNNKAGWFGGGTYTVESNGAPCSPITTNTTAVGNKADSSGGGGYDDGNGNPLLRNSIVTGNYSPNGADEIDAPNTTAATALFNTIIGDEFFLTGTTSPVIVSSQIFVDTANGDYTLATGSYPIDKGDSAYFNNGMSPDLSSINFDIRAGVRIMGSNIDMGAYEFCSDTLKNWVSILSPSNNSVFESWDTITFLAGYPSFIKNPEFKWYINEIDSQRTDNPWVVISGYLGLHIFTSDTVTVTLNSSSPCLDSSVSIDTIFISGRPGGISSKGNENRFNIFPNPNNGGFRLSGEFNESSDYSFQVYNFSGGIIYKEDVENQNIDPYEVYIGSEFPPGLYFLNVFEDGNMMESIKFIMK